MTNVAVVGSQWGDEGKGKIVDWLSERADVVVRFQGGHNAGHTLVIDGITYKLSALPSGVVRKGKLSIIGNGVVIDPWALLGEIETIREQGIVVSSENLRIAENAALILPLHGELDRAREEGRPWTAPRLASARSARQGAASAPPMKTRLQGGRSGSAISPIARTARGQEARGPSGPSQRPSPRVLKRDRDRGSRRCSRPCSRSSHHKLLPYRRADLAPALAELKPPRAGVSCSRAPRARCSMSITAPTPSSPRRTRSPAPRPTGAGARAGRRRLSSSASPRPTPPASAPGPFPTELEGRDRHSGWASAATSSAP